MEKFTPGISEEATGAAAEQGIQQPSIDMQIPAPLIESQLPPRGHVLFIEF